MNPVMATYLFQIAAGRDEAVAQAVDKLGWKPRRPPPEDTLGGFVHFMSMVLLPPDLHGPAPRAWLLIEVCADGGEDTLPARLADAIPSELALVLQALGHNASAPAAIAALLDQHRMQMGTSLLKRPGLLFCGTPGMTVQRIRDEARLASKVRQMLRADTLPAGPALRKLAHVRRQVFEDPALKWALVSEPVPLLAPRRSSSAVGRALALVGAAWRDYLWVLLPLPMLVGALAGTLFGLGVLDAVGCALLTLAAEAFLLGLVAAWGYRRLLQEEDADDPLDQEPDPTAMDTLMKMENHRDVAQNHLAAQSRMKPGWVRYWALRLALWGVAELTRLRSAPGFLNQIGTIHFARWYLVPGTDRLVFLSNYDGSWQSYLEDFIARLRRGLSSVWSNTHDFPRTRQLTSGGAADGARFKRWARRQQLPTLAWFTAYPQLSAGSIRTNAAIRHGLASAGTEAQAAQWLSRLGHAAPHTLEQQQVPTLVFGSLRKLRHAHALVLRLSAGADARAWLAACLPELSYGEHPGTGRALVVGFTITGLDKLGLPAAARRDFPAAFTQGMGHEARARLLGDFDGGHENGSALPRWGLEGEPVDALCMVYTEHKADLQTYLETLRQRLAAHNHPKPAYEREMADMPGKDEPFKEPFGFRDGISQPVVRGTKNWTAAHKAHHVVNLGELVLGYPDNLGRQAPTPCAGGHDYGRNGTYLVVRHLAQDREAFDKFLSAQAELLVRPRKLDTHADEHEMKQEQDRLAKERAQMQEWVAAKMVGRWRDGTPLVRVPNPPSARDPHAKPPSPERDNDFLYGKEDPDGLRCPFGAHIRRANPRDSLDPGSDVQLAISNRHRILRVSRRLGGTGGEQPGTFFMCLNADIERQFEFLQQTWLNGPNFHGLDNEVDPLLGPGGSNQALTVPGVNGAVRLEPLSRFVRALGGGYFFLPGKDCMALLAGGPNAAA